MLFVCYEKSSLKTFVSEFEIFVAMLSGLAHDLNHKAVNNAYKVKKNNKYQILASDQAVLENMHCATFFNILMENDDANILKYLANEEQKNTFKKLVITSILATDFVNF